ncbi:hypothetical protein GLYMA_09G130700v4 [Glycine max]|uniref:ABC transporter G family member 40 n=1 Tax=Glycine max TaxID=3847 RepID=UPI001B357630|nr:ABC transporter G family member 40-like [Glycine max]XP_040860792.1 ABC transporter G family member 40-like [Glycine max]XP_040860793.1 ABC transporter G family member 40-like [Glycine max]XP_040860794.1 ABC transporter G family member 40-like [Glycine max]KAG4388234.1 hypothetical protein GLYMA_09G130700v4 [Glycine max]KAH1042812.1 hypothetical protein GYH30_024906 [Glycine max]
MIRHVDVTMDQVWGWLSCLQGLCQQKSKGVDRPQWSTFSHVNYSGSLSSTFGSKALATEGEKENFMTDYVLRILGLEVCADTIVGNAMLRGISGGQRKRVTTGEMLVGPANDLFMDEISTGLDSSTTYQILNSLKQCVHILKGTTAISLNFNEISTSLDSSTTYCSLLHFNDMLV